MVEVRELDGRATLADAATTLAAQLRLDAHQLDLAAHWADLHDPASLPAPETELEVRRRRFDREYGTQPGGEGTPEVLAHCFAELGLVLQTSAGGAKHLVADALDLRHRLPSLWAEVHGGQVRAWKARRVAQATRHLPLAVMRDVDAGLAGLLPALPWNRFEAVLDATVMRADPLGARLAEAGAASRRFVTLGRDDRDAYGLKTLIARGEVLDILTFLAAVNRVADCLAADGDVDTVEVRRSKAVGILGQPDRALALLTAHQHDLDLPPTPAEPAQPRRRRGWRPCNGDDETSEPGEPAEPAQHVEPAEREAGAPEHDEDQRPTPQDEDEPVGNGPDDPCTEVGTRSLDLTGPLSTTSTTCTGSSIKVQLYVHLTDAALSGTDPTAVCRVEGVGPVTVATIRRWLRRPDVRVTVRPVAVPGDAVPVDAYQIPRSTRQAVLLRDPASAYPWSSCTDRTSLQLDHVAPYLDPAHGGPPGQTDPHNLAPLVGPEHQRKTSRRWRERTPAPGVFLWRSPHGWISLVTNQGTFPLGDSTPAHAIWAATATPDGTRTTEEPQAA